MYARLPAVNNVRRHQIRQILEPQTCRLSFAMPKLPRLNDLIGLANVTANDANGVLQRDTWYGRRKQRFHEFQCFGLLHTLLPKPAGTAYGKVGTRRVRDHQIPLAAQQDADVSLMVWPWALARQKVA